MSKDEKKEVYTLGELSNKFSLGSLFLNQKQSEDLNNMKIDPSKQPKTNSNGIPKNYMIILFVLLFLILLCGWVFFLNPYKILNNYYKEYLIFFIVIIFCVLIFFEKYRKLSSSQKDESLSMLYTRFSIHFMSYFTFIGIMSIIAFVLYIVYKATNYFAIKMVKTSILLTTGFVLLILTFFAKTSKANTFNNPLMDLVKDVIMYIPCLIDDAIDFIFKDYKNTPSSVIVVFGLLMVYIFIFYLFPFIQQEIYKNDGLLLLETESYLNQSQLSLTQDELNQKLYDMMPFYDRWVKNIMKQMYEVTFYDLSDNELPLKTKSIFDVSNNINNSYYVYRDDIPADRVDMDVVTRKYYNAIMNNPNILTKLRSQITEGFSSQVITDISGEISELEKIRNDYGFTSTLNQDIIGINQTKNAILSVKDRTLKFLSGEDPETQENIDYANEIASNIKTGLLNDILTDPNVLKGLDKLQLLYAAGMSGRDALIHSIFNASPEYLEEFSYHYSISMWVFLHKLNGSYNNNRQTILTYGGLPSIYYNTQTSELMMIVTDHNGNEEILFQTNKILYQKWNHILINYNYGTVDLFINNNLVGTYNNITPQVDTDRILLTIGSSANKNIGGICNVKYYNYPLSVENIQSIYTQFYKKNPPLPNKWFNLPTITVL
jgi:hypothetical protein